MSTQALQLREAGGLAEWEVIRSQAAVLVKTGFLPPSIKTPEQAMAIILTGRELGIGTMAALNSINVIQGKPTVSPQLMMALINRTKELEDLKLEATNDGAVCTIKRKGRTPYTAKFGPQEAAAMNLSGKDNYKKQPATMYKWRALADAARTIFPDAVLGLYIPDEMGAEVEPETGQVVDIQPESAQQRQQIAQNASEEVKAAINAQSPFDEEERQRLIRADLIEIVKKVARQAGLDTKRALRTFLAAELEVAYDAKDELTPWLHGLGAEGLRMAIDKLQGLVHAQAESVDAGADNAPSADEVFQ